MNAHEQHALYEAVREYGRVSRELGRRMMEAPGETVRARYAEAEQASDKAFKRVLDLIWPGATLTKQEKRDRPVVAGIERASRELDDARIGALRYEVREDDDAQDNS